MDNNIIDILRIILSRNVIMIGGRFGKGKSLSMTALTFFDIVLNNRFNILSNMPFNFPLFENINITPLTNTHQFDRIPNGTLIIWDEIYADLFSRSSGSVRNKYITIFSRDIRKIKGKIIGSVQFFDMLEKNMGLILEVIIIPEYVNIYSKITTEDMKKRIENKDFIIKWNIIDKLTNSEYELTLNLYDFIFMYDTNFKPFTLFVNHTEFVEKVKPSQIDSFRHQEEEELKMRIEHFNDNVFNTE